MFSFSKRALCVLCVCATLGASGSAFASNSVNAVTTSPSNVITQRVDVPSDVAAQDPTYSAAEAQRFAKSQQGAPSARATSWNVWGERVRNGSNRTSKPVGYSEHVKDGSVLDTYHYTRTFVGSEWDPRSDSDRVWGYGTVRAGGKYIEDEVFDLYVHRVFYGTES